MDAMVEKLGDYTVIEELRQGGMARTVLCRAPDQRLVVVKMPLHDDPDLFARMRDEHRVGSRVHHDHLVQTVAMFQHEGRPALVLTYVKGVPIADLRHRGVLAAGVVARIGAQIASALNALHEARGDDGALLGIVHRDVSTGNILVSSSGDACLIDLGIARWEESRSAHTETGSLIGTARYFAPEVISDGVSSGPSDVWALACCLVELLLDRSCFPGRAQEVLVAVSRYRGPAEILGDALATPIGQILGRALKRDPARRPTAAALAVSLAEVEAAAGGASADLADLAAAVLADGRARRARSNQSAVSVSATTAVDRSPSISEPPQATRGPLIGAAIAAVAVVVGVGVGLVISTSPPPNAAAAPAGVDAPSTPPAMAAGALPANAFSDTPDDGRGTPVGDGHRPGEFRPPLEVLVAEVSRCGITPEEVKRFIRSDAPRNQRYPVAMDWWHRCGSPLPPRSPGFGPAPVDDTGRRDSSQLASLLNEGRRLMYVGNAPAALERFLEAERLAPDDARSQRGLAYSLGRLHRLDEARVHYDRLLTLTPSAARDQELRDLLFP